MAQHFDGFNAAANKSNTQAVPAEDQIEDVQEELAEEHNEAPTPDAPDEVKDESGETTENS